VEGQRTWLTLARAEGVGRSRLAKLMRAFPDPADAWRLSVADLIGLESWGRGSARALLAIRQSLAAQKAAEEELERARVAGLRLILMTDPDYPVCLHQTPDPPPFFYQSGPWTPDHKPMVAVIGSRRPTTYGIAVAEQFGRELGRAGAVVVSGMARGIDCAAHRGALEVGGTTLAILGGGADVIYPREAASLYAKIRETGAVISEQPPGAAPRAEFFPGRNRIISGLSRAVVVVESGEKSGTLITVDAALEQGREVFAVPGPVFSPLSVGPNRLIRDGASIATTPADVIDYLRTSGSTGGGVDLACLVPGIVHQVQAGGHWRLDPVGVQPAGSRLSAAQEQLLGWMGPQPRWASDLVQACGLVAAEVQSHLTMLELKGLIRLLPDGQYVRVR
jgi:DNA processing protein